MKSVLSALKMEEDKSVLVVAPDQYTNVARQLCHHLSKLNGVTASPWTIKHYKDNESTLDGKQYVLLLGAKEENDLTKDFADIIKPAYSEAGVCCGFDGSKALCYGEGKLDQEKNFKNWLSVGAGVALFTSRSVGVRLLLGSLFEGGLLIFAAPWAAMFVARKVKDARAKKVLQMKQTKAAGAYFMDHFLHRWLEIPKEMEGND